MAELSKLIKELDVMVDSYTGIMARNQATSFDHYKFLVGKIEGLLEAKKLINETISNEEKDDEYDWELRATYRRRAVKATS